MVDNNPLAWKSRIKELFIDWLFISAYLICLLIVSLIFYHLVFGQIPFLAEWQSQVIASLSSVLPITILFAYMDYKGGSWGKRKAKLNLYFTRKTFAACLLRNIIKFTPWQIGHMATIRGIYQDFDTISLLMQFLSILLLLTMATMGFGRKDKRHLGDLAAGTQVQPDQL